MQPQLQFLGQFLDQFGASDGLNFASPRPLNALKWISPPARRGKKDIRVKNGCEGHGYFSCSKSFTNASRSSSDRRSQFTGFP